MYSKPRLLILSLTVALTTGCKSDEEKAAEVAVKSMEEATKKMEEAAKSGGAGIGDAMAAMGAAMGGGKKVETVDYQELKAMLPESLSGLNRTAATGEKTAAMGMQISMAEGRYSNDQGRSITMKITDIGSMSGLAGMATYAWAATEFDRETATGYEKTTKFNGHKAQEKYDRQSKSGELSVLVGSRFVVEADGNGVEMDALKDALGKVDLGKLDGMKTKGVE